MATNNEIEFKQILNENVYNDIKHKYFKDDIPFKQINYYIDTEDFKLKSNQSALRIRVKDDTYEMTLKVPAEVGLTEYNFDVSIEPKINKVISHDQLPSDIRHIISEKYGIQDGSLSILGALTTYRMETNYKNELLVLDKSEYLGTEDYELEFEVNQYEEGLTKFNELLQSFNLAHQKPLNKVQRFFERKKELS
ncbi:CYTH domain-containing protein [Staphylococcus pasteuri]|uniref:CYTH domain-containing protein n=1 Tax=Staphylococcus pasteuri TaxID=45972 RepID=UPI0032605E90